MANPQLENGFIRIANEIWQALRAMRIPGEAMQILMVILEETYGWQRKEAMIQNKTFAEKTGIKKQNIQRAISKLIELRLIKVIKKDYDCAPTYCFNKDYESWKKVIKKDYSNQKRLQGVIKSDYSEVSKVITPTMPEPFSGNGSDDPKDSIKDSIKDKRKEKLPSRKILLELWNKHAKTVPKIIEPFAKERLDKAGVRLNFHAHCKCHDDVDDYLHDWEIACIACNLLPFTRGENDRNWKASIDWLLKNDVNMDKIFEGKYGQVPYAQIESIINGHNRSEVTKSR